MHKHNPCLFKEKSSELIKKIQQLKTERDAIILGHNYQRNEVQEISDFLGDSLDLSIAATKTQARVIVFCGVKFMAETAHILSPQKTVLLPDLKAGCPMADMINAEELRQKKQEHPGAAVVCYINTTASVKAECDVCCTSANATTIIAKLEAEEIIFVPDKSMGQWLENKTTKNILLWPGFCPTHHRILAEDILSLKERFPDALVILHPESTPDVIKLADFVGGTGKLIQFVQNSKEKRFIVGTEEGIIHRMKRENPAKEFFLPSPRIVCPDMKLTTLEKIYWCLQDLNNIITVPEDIRLKARRCIDRMFELMEA